MKRSELREMEAGATWEVAVMDAEEDRPAAVLLRLRPGGLELDQSDLELLGVTLFAGSHTLDMIEGLVTTGFRAPSFPGAIGRGKRG